MKILEIDFEKYRIDTFYIIFKCVLTITIFFMKFWLEYFESKRIEFYIFIIFGIQIIGITITHYYNFSTLFYFIPKIKLRSNQLYLLLYTQVNSYN